MFETNKLLFGCVADDFTGGSDASSFLTLGGMRTILSCGVPGKDFHLPADCDAVVIALKSRTQETAHAVSDSLDAFRWLQAHGAEHLYFKYCSTFDSTPQGNIGPVADAVLETLGFRGTILCPALIANDRKVKEGILYVKGVPLAESPMRNHPLTPMTQSRIADLMAPQSAYDALEIHSDELRGDEKSVKTKIKAFSQDRKHWYIIPDYTEEADAEKIVSLFGDMPFLTGGSGILAALARHIKGNGSAQHTFPGTEGKALLVAGSCSTATHAQTLWYEKNGGELLRLTDDGLLDGSENPESIWNRLREMNAAAPLVYSYDTPEGLAKKRDEKGKRLSALIEKALSGTAALAVKNGVTRIIAAGGETSGAVTQALGYQSFWIGESIAPGVPVLIPVEDQRIRLVLKSGNFGQEDFFGRALALTGGKDI